MTSRRAFLSTLFGAAAVAADPEKLLWVPKKRIYSIPSVVIPPCPFKIEALHDCDRDIVLTINRLLGFRWERDSAFRREVEIRTAPAVALDALDSLQMGRGFFALGEVYR